MNAIPFKQNLVTPLWEREYELCPALSFTLPFPSFPLFSPVFYYSTSTRTSTRKTEATWARPPRGGIFIGFLARGAERIKVVPTGAQRLIKGIKNEVENLTPRERRTDLQRAATAKAMHEMGFQMSWPRG